MSLFGDGTAKEALWREIMWKSQSYGLTQEELIVLLAEIISEIPKHSGLFK